MTVPRTRDPRPTMGLWPRLPALESQAHASEAVLLDNLLKTTLDGFVAGFSEQVAVVDGSWIILSINDAWQRMVNETGYRELVCGTDYRQFLRTFASKGHVNAAAALDGVRRIDGGDTDCFDF